MTRQISLGFRHLIPRTVVRGGQTMNPFFHTLSLTLFCCVDDDDDLCSCQVSPCCNLAMPTTLAL